jgi:dolichol-phosphate mannosyltransferase
LRKLFTFFGICAIGATANVGMASYPFSTHQTWWIAGLPGVIVGAVWNYAMSSILTRRAPEDRLAWRLSSSHASSIQKP